MSSPSDSSYPGFPLVQASTGDPSAYLSSLPTIDEASNSPTCEPDVAHSDVSSPTLRSLPREKSQPGHPLANGHGCRTPQSMSDIPSPIQTASRSSSNIIEPNNPLGYSSGSIREQSSSIGYEYQLEVITAAAIVTIQLQLLSMAVATPSRALLSIGMILELLGILLAICLVQTHNTITIHHSRSHSILLRLSSGIPTLSIWMGIIGLGAALVVETLQTSLGTAVTMSSLLVLGVILCLIALLHNVRVAAQGEGGSGHGYA